VGVPNEAGQLVRRAKVRTVDDMIRTLEALRDRLEVCYEASCGYGRYHDLLSPIAARVVAAHPGRLRLIFRSKKNDRKDAERLDTHYEDKTLHVEIESGTQAASRDPTSRMATTWH
jgi:hypothetical protein